MDRNSRLIMLLLVLALSVVRLVRYLRTTTSRRSSPAIPSTTGAMGPASPSPASSVSPASPAAAVECAAASAPAPISPIDVPGSTAGRFVGGLAAALVLIVGNVVIWSCLFGIPPLEEVPPLLRGLAGVLANFYLIHLARAAAARGQRVIGSRTGEDKNPIR